MPPVLHDTFVLFVSFNTDVFSVFHVPSAFFVLKAPGVLFVFHVPFVSFVLKAPDVLPVSNNTIPKQVTKINNFLF